MSNIITDEEIKKKAHNGRKVKAIQQLRIDTGISIKSAKAYVDELLAGRNPDREDFDITEENKDLNMFHISKKVNDLISYINENRPDIDNDILSKLYSISDDLRQINFYDEGIESDTVQIEKRLNNVIGELQSISADLYEVNIEKESLLDKGSGYEALERAEKMLDDVKDEVQEIGHESKELVVDESIQKGDLVSIIMGPKKVYGLLVEKIGDYTWTVWYSSQEGDFKVGDFKENKIDEKVGSFVPQDGFFSRTLDTQGGVLVIDREYPEYRVDISLALHGYQEQTKTRCTSVDGTIYDVGEDVLERTGILLTVQEIREIFGE